MSSPAPSAANPALTPIWTAEGLERLSFYASDAELATLRQQAGDLKGWIALAWHLREREPPEAQRLAKRAMDLLQAHSPAPHLNGLRARTLVTLADLLRMASQLDETQALLDEALRGFELAQEPLGIADVLWVRSQVQGARGQAQACGESLERAIELAWGANELERVWVLEVALAKHTGFMDSAAAKARWEAHLRRADAPAPAAAAPMVLLWEAYQEFRVSAFATAIAGFSLALPSLLAQGFVREAIVACTNATSAYVSLLDADAAQDWLEQALALARPTGWPAVLGLCLLQSATVWRLHGDLPNARVAVVDALCLLTKDRSQRNHLLGLEAQGDIELELGEPDLALSRFLQLIENSPFADLQLRGRLGQGRALLMLGQAEQALAAGQAALALAQARAATDGAMQALRLCAGATGALAGRLDGADQKRLALLVQADQLMQSVPGQMPDAALLTELAESHAKLGEFQAAYAASHRAELAHTQRHQRDLALKRQAALARLHTEGARASAEMHRLQAEANQQRAELQAAASAKLERLGHIGQQLTQHLDHEAIFGSLAEHVPTLLDARGFEVYLLDADRRGLVSVFGLEDGVRLPADVVDWDDPHSYTARSARQRLELFVDLPSDGSDPSQVPGTLRTLSAMFGPLVVGDRFIGVLTVQSPHAKAYGVQEQMVFRTLRAYAAIALDNAGAYQRLRDARRQLVNQERMASLGALVAGVAHELNTPLGNSLLMASTLEQRLAQLANSVQANNLRKSELLAFVDEGQTAIGLLVRSLSSAAQLIGDFKQVAVDRTAERRRRFDLAETSHQICQTVQARMRQQGHQIQLDIPEGLELDSYPGPLGQVLANLINNALLHAFEGRNDGQMHLTARRLLGEQVELRFMDNGCGVAPQHVTRLFEPFFTTKFGQGGSGLGLSISHNIVSSLLGGELTLDAQHAPGACFVITLPLRAPEPSAGPTDFRQTAS